MPRNKERLTPGGWIFILGFSAYVVASYAMSFSWLWM